jgi:hypothetical protein
MITFNEYLNEAENNFVAKSYFERLCKKYKFKVLHYHERDDYFELKFTNGVFEFYVNYMERELNKFTMSSKEFFTNKFEKLEEDKTTLTNVQTIVKDFEKYIKKV